MKLLSIDCLVFTFEFFLQVVAGGGCFSGWVCLSFIRFLNCQFLITLTWEFNSHWSAKTSSLYAINYQCPSSSIAISITLIPISLTSISQQLNFNWLKQHFNSCHSNGVVVWRFLVLFQMTFPRWSMFNLFLWFSFDTIEF
jgi:hypothetical protein